MIENLGEILHQEETSIIASLSNHQQLVDSVWGKLGDFDIAEVRADLLLDDYSKVILHDQPNPKEINKLKIDHLRSCLELLSAASIPTLFTLRNKEFGGKYEAGVSHKIEIVEAVSDLVQGYDFDLLEPGALGLVTAVRRVGKTAIGSYHQFEPGGVSRDGLLGPSFDPIRAEAEKQEVDFTKFAFRIDTLDEAVKLAKYAVRNRSSNVIAMGMADPTPSLTQQQSIFAAKSSRRFAFEDHAFAVYASPADENGQTLVPGQLTLENAIEYRQFVSEK